MKRLFKILVVTVTVLFIFASCSLFSPDSKDLSMSVTGAPDSYTRSMSSRAVGDTEGVATELGGARIVVSKVEMVILELELEVDSDSLNSAVEDIEAGPFLFELPLDGSAANLFEGILIPAGLYEELEIEVDAPGDEYEAYFAEKNWPREVSIRVTGTYQADVNDDTTIENFVYEQLDFNEDFEIEFEPALQIAGGETNIVLAIDVSTWFLNEDKNGLLNPIAIMEAEQDHEDASTVEDNIENSFEAFEDSLED